MKSFLTLVSILIATGVIVGGISKAADTDAITATVTARNVSVSVADAAIAYGNVTLSGTASTTSSGTNDTQIATADGNVSETFNIIGTDSATWTLESSIGTDNYTHAFCNTLTCDSSPTWTLMQQAAYTTLSSSTVATTSGTQNFDLKIVVPSASGSYTQQSVDMTVQAVISY